MTRKVFFYVQHLLGVGHVYRATRVAQGLQEAGFEVHLIWGGTDVPGFDFTGLYVHRLTPVRTGDALFGELVHANGREFTESDKNARASELLNLLRLINPHVLITEAFPFGRRQMQFELLPLLAEAANSKPRPMIVASIRDIMQEGRKPKRVEESVELVSKYFDLVLVHGDPNFITIEETLQGIGQFKEKIRYTGLVTPGPLPEIASDKKKYSVLATVGGGAFGSELLECVLETARKHAAEFPKWLVSGGSELPDSDFDKLVERVPSNVKMVKHIPDLASAMRGTEVSVSHSGYNTVADVLRAGCRSVLYPYTGGRETEQLRRAQKLDDLGLAHMIGPGNLSTTNLASAINNVLHRPAVSLSLDLEGASKTAKVLETELAGWKVNR